MQVATNGISGTDFYEGNLKTQGLRVFYKFVTIACFYILFFRAITLYGQISMSVYMCVQEWIPGVCPITLVFEDQVCHRTQVLLIW